MPKTSSESNSFADRVRVVVKAIPPGQVMSYQAVAKAAGSPRAARAVATIMANNYRSDIPCHRVIRADGTLGGYNRGGTSAKYALLCQEGYYQ